MEPKEDAVKTLQQQLQDEEPPAPIEEPEEEQEERQRLLTLGVMDIDKRLGGGLPADSLTLVDGDPDAGKSIVVQQLTFGALTLCATGAVLLLVPPMASSMFSDTLTQPTS